MPVQLRHLRYFTRIVEAGSFSRAASVVHIAQPALSQQIAELELDLGVTLLHRSARGVAPTPAGDVLYHEAVSILGRIEQLPELVRSGGPEIEGTVNIGTSSTLAASLFGPIRQGVPRRAAQGHPALLHGRRHRAEGTARGTHPASGVHVRRRLRGGVRAPAGVSPVLLPDPR